MRIVKDCKKQFLIKKNYKYLKNKIDEYIKKYHDNSL